MHRAIEAAAEQDAPGTARVLPEDVALALAGKFGAGLHEVHRAALKLGVCPQRYLRNMGAISIEEQLRLLNSKAAIVGLGGLGSQAALLLARMGVGELVLADGDRFEPTNLNRQALCIQGALGRSKAEHAVKAVADVNPGVLAIPFPTPLDADNADQVLLGCGVAVDGLDNLPSRFILQDACRRLAVPLVHGTAAGWEGWVSVVRPVDAGLDDLYGGRGVPKPEDRPEAVLGVLAPTAAAVGSLQASEAARVLLGRPGLRRRMLHLDLDGGGTQTFWY